MLIKRWMIRERGEVEPEDNDMELFELVRGIISASKLKKLPGHVYKKTDYALWKQYRHYNSKRGVYIQVRLF